jgi:hypothetical protein
MRVEINEPGKDGKPTRIQPTDRLRPRLFREGKIIANLPDDPAFNDQRAVPE